MKQYYECHVTMIGDPQKIEQEVQKLKWKFSKIDGDINLGDGIKCYATKQFNKKFDLEYVTKKVNFVADKLKNHSEVLRKKVEFILFDSKIV